MLTIYIYWCSKQNIVQNAIQSHYCMYHQCNDEIWSHVTLVGHVHHNFTTWARGIITRWALGSDLHYWILLDDLWNLHFFYFFLFLFMIRGESSYGGGVCKQCTFHCSIIYRSAALAPLLFATVIAISLLFLFSYVLLYFQTSCCYSLLFTSREAIYFLVLYLCITHNSVNLAREYTTVSFGFERF
jgi:hypothetical protein